MKKIIACLSIAAVFSCKQAPEPVKDYVTFSGKIENQNSDSLFVYQGRDFSKTIKVAPDGTFKDTFKIATPGIYSFYDGGESSSIYLQNGYELDLTLNAQEFDESVSYTGNGSESSNFLAKKALMQENLFPPSLMDMEPADFKTSITGIQTKLKTFVENNQTIDSTLLADETKGVESFMDDMQKSYDGYQKQVAERAAQFAPFIGKPSPDFVNYENYKGGTTSLKDLRGKYVYVDLWATWCGPCKAEIPFLKEVEKEYHDKNIEFVSISVDNGRGFKGNSMELAKEGWKNMIKEKELGGIQLMSDKDWKSDFVTGFNVRGIPRFILIDPKGNVVSADAPRPSSPKLKALFTELSI